jgi:hypothetical protein
MFSRIAILGLALCLVVGCSKKTAKLAGTSGDSTPPPAPTQTPAKPLKPNDKLEKSKPDNWLTDERAKGSEGQLPVENLPPKPGLGVKLPMYDPGQPLPSPPQPSSPPVAGGQAQPPAPPPVAPATGTSRPAPKPVTEADMKEVWIFIENFSGASGKMPPTQVVLAALIKAEAKAADLVKDGSIFLTGATARESIWAFETKALSNGGWVASQNGVEILSAADLKRRLGR